MRLDSLCRANPMCSHIPGPLCAMKKLLVLHVAALGAELLRRHGVETLAGLPVRTMIPVGPAVTCTAQATLRTGLPPEAHGMPANGLFFRETFQCAFWNQSAALVKGSRIWERFRARGGRVGLYFFQQSLGEAADEIVSPAPIHTHGGGMIMATYQQPARVLGVENPVTLWRYWGPLASPKVGRGIVSALTARLRRGDAPELMMAYLPTLDYALQRHGTCHPQVAFSVRELVAQVEALAAVAREQGYHLAIAGDYAITDVTGGVCFPNRALLREGLFAAREIRGMRYPDFYRSAAIALCDHQGALVYCLGAPDAVRRERVRALLASLPEVESVREAPGGGADYALIAKPGCWFAYPWWESPREAPDYAMHVDIHNKPGFDPCELFFGRNLFQCSADVSRIRGTHGRTDAPVVCATDLPLRLSPVADALAFARALAAWLDG